MTNAIYNRTFNLVDHVDDASAAPVKNEFALIEAGFDLFPPFTGNAGKLIGVNSGETAFEAISPTVPGSLLALSGYYIVPAAPNNLIIQWTRGTSDASGNVLVTLPATFPNAFVNGVVCAGDGGSWASGSMFSWGLDYSACTVSQVAATSRKIVGTGVPVVAAGVICQLLCWGY